MSEFQPDLYGGPAVPAELTPPMREFEPLPLPRRTPITSVDALVRRAASASGVAVFDILGPSTNHNFGRVRKAIYLVAWETRSSALIGKIMRRDGSTIRKQAKVARALVTTDREFAALVNRIRG